MKTVKVNGQRIVLPYGEEFLPLTGNMAKEATRSIGANRAHVTDGFSNYRVNSISFIRCTKTKDYPFSFIEDAHKFRDYMREYSIKAGIIDPQGAA